jgi:hypothetical protein
MLRVEVKEKEERERKIPEHYKDWQSLFNWVGLRIVTRILQRHWNQT